MKKSITRETKAITKVTSFETLFQQYSDSVYGFMFYRCNRNEMLAMDLTQEVFFQAYKNFDRLQWDKPFALLCDIGRKRLARHFRGQARNTRKLQSYHTLLETTGGFTQGIAPEADLDREELQSLVGEALSNLPPHYVDALLRKYSQNQSMSEMAKDLDMSIKAIESLLTRSRAKFLSTMKQMDGDLHHD